MFIDQNDMASCQVKGGSSNSCCHFSKSCCLVVKSLRTVVEPHSKVVDCEGLIFLKSSNNVAFLGH